MSKQKMLAARELIQEKRYAEARTLLKTIDDPKAQEWLKKLDEIAPEKKKSGGNLILVTTVVVLLAVVIIAVTLITRQNNANDANQNAVAQVPTQMELPSATDIPVATNTPALTPTPECLVEVWWEESEQYLLDFLAYTDVAMETARISVGDVLVEMQRAKRNFQRLNVQPCYADAQRDLVTGMEFIIKGFGEFQSDMALSVNLNILYANESIGNGIQQLREIGVQLYDDVEEAYDDLFGDWSLASLRRLGAVTPACSPTEVTIWQNEVREIIYFLPMDVGDMFTMDMAIPENAFLRIVELDYPACVEDAREALLLTLDHAYQAIYYMYDDNTYSAADHLTDHEVEYQKYLDELKLIKPSQGSNT